MQLDIFTLLLILGTGCIFLGMVLLLAWLQNRSEDGLLWWSVSLFLRTPAFALILLRERIPDWLSIDVALALLLLGAGVSWAAARRQSCRPVNLVAVAAPAVLWLMAGRFPEIHSSLGNRVAFVSAELSVCALAIAWEFRRQSRTMGRLRAAMAAVFLLSGLVHAARAVYAAVHPIPEMLPDIGNLVASSLYVYLLILFAGGVIAVSFYWEQLVSSLKYEADYDSLTNVLNRRAFEARAENLLRPGARRQAPIALLVFDLDHFKSVNDRFGHSGGDTVLCGFCALVQGQLRNVDLFARIGGEEFAALLPNVGRQESGRVAEQLRRAVAELQIDRPGGPVSVTVSIGVAVADTAGVRLDELMTRADAALYDAKTRGRNRVRSAGQARADQASFPPPGARRAEQLAG
ncbi:sensor domain-containing diguanylate cyclase [Roseibium salinum]|uniref:diguanylate cyclase n=1 Tax=Roseibium salinum TaxID=1604349 RepID=A0ABT3QXL7_9HYPH|nr:GGDEF domain-containing protein [Roseibium sp. DSM 29163]MCX2721586.1 GGDEF domain-containing protein [Roseibium sp. DSM 29163]MDN3722049.1 GGDEF domain-containing protein [Roseibium salinum]